MIYDCGITCRELNIVKSQANAVVFTLTVRIPKAHVRPSKGNRTIEAVIIALKNQKISIVCMQE